MQPQGQDTPQPTPNPTPSPTPQNTPPPQAPQTPPTGPTANNPTQPTASPAPSATPPQHSVMPNTTMGQPKKSPVLAISIIAGIIVLVGAAVLAYFMFFTGTALEKYDAEKYSMQVPVGFTKEDEGDGVVFTEPGDKATASSVFAYYDEFPGAPTQAQIDAAKESFKSQLESTIDSYTSGTHTITDVKVEDTTYKGQEAILATAKAKSSSSEGMVKMIAVIDTEKIYIVGVAADGGDRGLIAKTDEIINSFTVK